MSRYSLLLGMFCAAGNLCLPLPGSGQTNAPEDQAEATIELSKAPAPSEEDIRKALLTEVKADFTKTPLNRVMKSIAETTGTNTHIDEQALGEEGLNIDEPITHKSQPLAAARLLDRILPSLGLTWIIHNDVVQITTIIAAEDNLVTRTYPVGDLIEYAKKHPLEDLDPMTIPGLHTVQFGDPGAGGCGCLPSSDGDALWLIDLLQQHTPGPWMDIDGTGGSMSYLNNNLVIRQTHRVQVEVAGILETLRQFTKGELKPAAVPIRPPHYALEEDEVVRKALRKVVSVKSNKRPLDKFLTDVTTRLEIPLHIDKQALAEEGVTTDEPITVDFKNLPAKSLLKVVFDPLGLTALVDDGRLLVTTVIAAEAHSYTVLHDLRDMHLGEYTGQELIDLLMNETSGPWMDVDGTGGKMEVPLKGLLVVRQTQKVQDEIAMILSDLRKSSAEAPPENGEETPPPDPKEVVTKMYRIDFISQPESAKKALFALVEPKTWAEQGGEGDIVIVDRTLIVKNQNAVQEQVQKFLDNLHKAEQVPRLPNPMGPGDGNGNPGGVNGAGFFRVPPRDAQ